MSPGLESFKQERGESIKARDLLVQLYTAFQNREEDGRTLSEIIDNVIKGEEPVYIFKSNGRQKAEGLVNNVLGRRI